LNEPSSGSRIFNKDVVMSVANDPNSVFGAALALPREKREQLVRELIVSLDQDRSKDPDYDRLWAEEIERRWSAYERGEAQAIDHDEAMRRIQNAMAKSPIGS
jgi:putative addiction module component (TIGR02574 family)